MSSRADLLASGVATLTAAGIEGAPRDARLLLRWASGLEAAAFSARLSDSSPADETARFAAAIALRAARRPVSQIVGGREFWGRRFAVSADVLDPRPETETLIAAALDGPRPEAVLDLGLGSGCILLTLLAEWPETIGMGVERSPAALALARANAEAHGVADRAQLLEGDWFAPVRGRFGLVVSNPPYIPEAEVEALDPEVRDWEPMGALAAGPDGLADYRTLAAGLDRALAPGGRAILEIGAGQENDVAAIFAEQGFRLHAAHPDLDGRPRALEFRRSEADFR
ncbi:[protein release factor]-glutamine N5-methyltransferase [Albimonas donghaensis]|uniref:Release factor glutamine methyltransferase n=1 Tax=Albimonas donghaensis TaxID=356660 RepID=A0A1H2SQQ4_9RHOB|nr:peptide chain release factor N(5)-glutamine methyltransferase [Albimonas donghaensis]SDW33983.1 [protein release factor]-glutamine N5-methyltransferase [Albimonas donghaensis]